MKSSLCPAQAPRTHSQSRAWRLLAAVEICTQLYNVNTVKQIVEKLEIWLPYFPFYAEMLWLTATWHKANCYCTKFEDLMLKKKLYLWNCQTGHQWRCLSWLTLSKPDVPGCFDLICFEIFQDALWPVDKGRETFRFQYPSTGLLFKGPKFLLVGLIGSWNLVNGLKGCFFFHLKIKKTIKKKTGSRFNSWFSPGTPASSHRPKTCMLG